MAGKIENTVHELIAMHIEGLGFELVDIEYKKEGTEKILYIYADRPGGITIDECEKISRCVEPVLDQNDPISERYYLCVSSPGLDRPFHNANDYRRNLGKAIEIKLYAPYLNKKDYSGILKSFDDEHIIMETNGQEASFKLSDIARARLAIEF
jgi:ribosome maturation factor RimP